VIPAKPAIKGFEAFGSTDVPTVYQLPGDKKWYMTFIAFNGKGYQSFVAESDDLVHWTNMRLAMGFGPEGAFDYGGVVLGALLYGDYDIKARRELKKHDGKYISLYGAYPRQGGYELRPGYEGIASSEDGLTWRRAKDEPILSVHQSDCGKWEKDCIYQPWLVEHEGRYFDFYNAANGGRGLALPRCSAVPARRDPRCCPIYSGRTAGTGTSVPIPMSIGIGTTEPVPCAVVLWPENQSGCIQGKSRLMGTMPPRLGFAVLLFGPCLSFGACYLELAYCPRAP